MYYTDIIDQGQFLCVCIYVCVSSSIWTSENFFCAYLTFWNTC